MISFRGVMTLVTAAVLARTASAQDPAGPWPQFRGPGGSGVAEQQKPPVNFGPDKNVKWKVKAPGGWSSPIVAGDKLVITTKFGENENVQTWSLAGGVLTIERTGGRGPSKTTYKKTT